MPSHSKIMNQIRELQVSFMEELKKIIQEGSWRGPGGSGYPLSTGPQLCSAPFLEHDLDFAPIGLWVGVIRGSPIH